jgi:hypothetical protein
MKITTLLFAFVLFTLWTISTGAVRNPNNPPTGVTGAPGEGTCVQSGCHGGGTYTGTVALSGLPDTVVANQSYSITLTQTSNAPRAGFEMTVLDSVKVKAGTFTAGSGCSVATNSGKQYVRQSAPKNLASGSVSWAFTWKAPATVTGHKIIFYFVSLMANGNGGTSGDKVATGNKTVILKTVTPVTEAELSGQIKLYPVPAHDLLHIDFPDANNARLTIFDAAGNLALQMTMRESNQIDVSNYPKGLYFAKIEQDGQSVSKTFVVQ